MEETYTSGHTFDPIIKIHNAKDHPWYHILTPFQLTYEYCSGTSPEDFCNILMISPLETRFRTIPFNRFSEFNARPAHRHDYFELLIVLKGTTIQKIEGKEFMYSAGTCCLISPELSHSERFTEETQLLFVGLSNEFVTELMESQKISYFKQERELQENFILQFAGTDKGKAKRYLDFFPRRRQTGCAALRDLSEALVNTAFSPHFGATYIIKGLLCQLLDHLASDALYHRALIELDSSADQLLFSRITHLFEDTDGRISRSELERILNYNGSYLNTIVKRHTGMCLFDYGMTFCLKKAALLLSTTETSVSAIASELHFTNRSHFYKLFKEKYGMTPQEYRKASQAPRSRE